MLNLLSFLAPAFPAYLLCTTSLYLPLGLKDLTPLTSIPLEHLGARGYIPAGITVTTSKHLPIPDIASKKVYGRLIFKITL